MSKKALIVQGGWDGHEPIQVSEIFKGVLEESGFQVGSCPIPWILFGRGETQNPGFDYSGVDYGPDY